MKIEDKILMRAMDWVDPRYVEEALEREEMSKDYTPKKSPNLRMVWIAASAAAIVIGLVAGGVILTKMNARRAEEAVTDTHRAEEVTNPLQAEEDPKTAENQATDVTDALSAEERILLLVADRSGAPISDGKYHYDVNGYYASDFKPYYGGTYRNAEGQLVVCLAESAGPEAIEEARENLRAECDLYEGVKYSYSDLINVMSDLLNYYHSEEYAAQRFQITKFEIDAAENAVQVSVTSTDDSALDEICKHIRLPEALIFSLTDEPGIPEEPNAPTYYGVLQCERDPDVDEFVREKADEMLEAVVTDPAFYHAEDRDLQDLYILAPFKLWEETAEGLMEVEEFFQYPVASNGRIICTIIVTRAGGELHYNVTDMYVLELNQACSDNRNRVVVFDEEASETGDRENEIRLVFLPDEDGSEHSAEDNVFLGLSGKYQN